MTTYWHAVLTEATNGEAVLIQNSNIWLLCCIMDSQSLKLKVPLFWFKRSCLKVSKIVICEYPIEDLLIISSPNWQLWSYIIIKKKKKFIRWWWNHCIDTNSSVERKYNNRRQADISRKYYTNYLWIVNKFNWYLKNVLNTQVIPTSVILEIRFLSYRAKQKQKITVFTHKCCLL